MDDESSGRRNGLDTNKIALQLYTVRENAKQDMIGTLRELAAMGYRAVEFAGYGNATVPEIQAALTELGIQTASAHVALTRLQSEAATVFDEMKALGCPYVVVPWAAEEYRQSVADVERLAAALNDFGRQCQQAGLQLGYHNHAFEFTSLDGQTIWERLLAATDPDLVVFELDVFWALAGGFDPVPLIQQHGARLPLLHLKDKPADSDRPDAPVGAGTLPWPAILAAGQAAGTRWYIVEQDHPQDPLADVGTSLRNLEGLFTQAG
jgi:sugar phosphate isomerase/epimerase